jgi:hypothetical protein
MGAAEMMPPQSHPTDPTYQTYPTYQTDQTHTTHQPYLPISFCNASACSFISG